MKADEVLIVEIRAAPLSGRGDNKVMHDAPSLDPVVCRATMIRQLRELIQALDARTPQLERVGEVEIAQEAAMLKVKALTRLAELGASS